MTRSRAAVLRGPGERYVVEDGNAAVLAEFPGAYAVASADPERVAIITPRSGRHMTFGELGAAANQVAHGLRALGLRRGDRVAGLMRNSAEHFEVLLAAFQIGLYVVPVNTHLAPGEVAYIVRDSGARALVATDALARALEPVTADLPEARFAVGDAVPGWRGYAELRDSQPSHQPGHRTAGAIMGYTSGTTGRPKGVRRQLPGVPPEQVIGAMGRHYSWFGRPAGQGVHLACSPLYHAAPGGHATYSLHIGHTVVIHERFDAERTLGDIERYGVTTTHLVPTHLHRLPAQPFAVEDATHARLAAATGHWRMRAQARRVATGAGGGHEAA